MSLYPSKRQLLSISALLIILQGITITLPPGGNAQAQQQYVVNGQPVSENVGKAMILCKNAGEMLMSSGKPEKALEMLTEAEQLAPELPEVQNNLGMALAKVGRTDEAIVHVEKAVALNPNLPAAEMTLGSLYQSVGRTEDAIRVFKAFQTHHPNSDLLPKVKGLVTMLESESKLRAQQEGNGAAGAGKDDYFNSISMSGAITKWTAKNMPLKVYLAPAQSVAGYKPSYLEAVKASFQEWADSSDGKISFQYVPDKDKSNISFAFSNDIKAVSNPAEGGEAKIYPGPQGITTAQIVVLTLDPSPGQAMNDGLMRWICLHEIGHSLGLMGHSPQHNDVMYSSMPLSTGNRGLSDRDKNTVKRLYSDAVTVHKAESAIATDTTNPLTLNNEGATALNAGNLELAIERLEKAHKIDQSLKVVKQNLAQAYCIKAMKTAQVGKTADADAIFKKSVALLDGGSSSPSEQMVLRSYAVYLRLANRVPEATKIESALKSRTAK
jgi:tetratricopeptide (TPR) repeat protein